ncbi:RHS repeat-associated core domain-containing protein [Pseudomonas sp. WJP1]|uniref:RHS repeat-associated core domain-containing protein n=1 Tax=Pseudomonas sp. WJP1 TaxID=2986947 RepID=UPI00234A2D81|nr:RHS repeat-associated core domain-containing protein [Pseudomonas sp. WJP1]WCM54081.1 RHS repeat-associated core domain-containing protein [Pseudomonas sp. WJP1]
MPQLPHILLCQYRYDPLDQLTGHTVTDTAERQRFYCRSRLATEIQGVLYLSIIQNDGQLLAQRQSEGDLIGTALLATGQERSVLNTLKSDCQPQPSNYSPYGHSPFESGLRSLLGFNGERPDPVTRHYLLGNGYRAYNPVLMRFNSPDSWSPFGKGGLNAYAYCLGDPVNQTDPTGHGIDITGLVPTVLRYRGKQPLKIVQKHIPTESIPAEPWGNSFDISKSTMKLDDYAREAKTAHAEQNTILREMHAEINYNYDSISIPKNKSFNFFDQARKRVLDTTVNQFGYPDLAYRELKKIAGRGKTSKTIRNFKYGSNHSLLTEWEGDVIEANKILKEVAARIKTLREGT